MCTSKNAIHSIFAFVENLILPQYQNENFNFDRKYLGNETSSSNSEFILKQQVDFSVFEVQ